MSNNEKLDSILEKLAKLDTIEEKLKTMSGGLTDVSTRLVTVENTIQGLDKIIKTKLEDYENNLQDLKREIDDDLEAFNKSSEIVVRGFPAVLKSTTTVFYRDFVSTIGFGATVTVNGQLMLDDSNDSTVSLLAPAPDAMIFQVTNKAQKSSIIIRFASPFYKEIFLKQYWTKAKSLSLSDFGYEGDGKISVNHNLSSNRYKVFKHAMGLKKAKQLDSIKVFGFGSVAVRFPGNKSFIPVKTIEEIDAKIAALSKGSTSNV